MSKKQIIYTAQQALLAIEQELELRGESLLGYVALSIPVYKIHLSYTAPSQDGFYALDWAILRLVDYCQKQGCEVNYNHIGYLLASSPGLIDVRRKMLIEQGYLQATEQSYELTEAGRRTFFDLDRRPGVTSYADVIVDGLDLQALAIKSDTSDEAIGYPLCQHKPFATSQFDTYMARIEDWSKERKAKHQLHEDAYDVCYRGDSQAYLKDCYLVFSSREGKLHKRLYHCGKELQELQIEAMRTRIAQLRLRFSSYLGQKGEQNFKLSCDTADNEQATALIVGYEEAKVYMAKRFKVEETVLTEEHLGFAEDKAIGQYALSLSVDQELFESCENQAALISALHKGRYELKFGAIFLYIGLEVKDEYMREVLELYRYMLSFKASERTLIELETELSARGLPHGQIRNILLRFGYKPELEQMAINTYFSYKG